MRDLARSLDPSGEILQALDDLEAEVPNFAILNAHAMDADSRSREG